MKFFFIRIKKMINVLLRLRDLVGISSSNDVFTSFALRFLRDLGIGLKFGSVPFGIGRDFNPISEV
jgi:hypothetical protein